MNRKITCRLTYFNVTLVLMSPLGKVTTLQPYFSAIATVGIGTLHITYHNFIKSIKGLKYFAKMFRRIIRVYHY